MYRYLQGLAISGLLLASPAAFAADHRVTVSSGGHGFSPQELTVNVGDTVTFTAVNDPLAHNVHANDDSFYSGAPRLGPWTYTVAFDSVRNVSYQCDPHAAMGMRGLIHVVQGSGGGGGGSSNVPITAGFTGAWYDPAQSGHGILVEILDGNQFLTWWFTFTPGGQQAWFGNVGTIDPATNTATVEALQTEGGRWIPNFDPTNVTNPVWGQLKFSFSDCNHGRVDFTSTMPGYGQGHMDLMRLTQPAGLSCP
ncbi:MAG TPA: plastocyanin/azurin family copper-binding protein [Rhodanobacteraceae bacterium]|jgi:plastocyanin|nr:plastocyanin/azurin family copper-binding protein [Rhodanobacteraceae bacterium]